MAAGVIEDAGYDFGDLTDESVSEVSSEPAPKATGTSRSSPSSPGGTRRGRKPRQSRLTDLQKKLSGEVFKAGALIGLPLPVTGYYICQESDAFTTAIVELASARPEWINALEQIARLEPGLVVGRTAFGIGAAMAVDRQRADPNSFVMTFLGVQQAYLAIQSKMTPGEAGSASNFKPPPSKFTPVS